MQQTLGKRIYAYRKEQGMTQLELAEKMGVTDKAVSKWERDLSAPDINSIPKLAELLDISVEALMQGTADADKHEPETTHKDLVDTALKGIGMAMGIAVAVLSILGKVETNSALAMLGIGLACISLAQLKQSAS